MLGGVVDEERPYAHLRRHVEELRDNPADEMRMLPQSLRYHAMHRFFLFADRRQPGAAEQQRDQQHQHGDRHIGHLHRALIAAAGGLAGREEQRAADQRADKLPEAVERLGELSRRSAPCASPNTVAYGLAAVSSSPNRWR